MGNIICGRCGKRIEPTSNWAMIQVIEYLGNISPRTPICGTCRNEFNIFMKEKNVQNDF